MSVFVLHNDMHQRHSGFHSMCVLYEALEKNVSTLGVPDI
jgi:hypothetical protein